MRWYKKYFRIDDIRNIVIMVIGFVILIVIIASIFQQSNSSGTSELNSFYYTIISLILILVILLSSMGANKQLSRRQKGNAAAIIKRHIYDKFYKLTIIMSALFSTSLVIYLAIFYFVESEILLHLSFNVIILNIFINSIAAIYLALKNNMTYLYSIKIEKEDRNKVMQCIYKLKGLVYYFFYRVKSTTKYIGFMTIFLLFLFYLFIAKITMADIMAYIVVVYFIIVFLTTEVSPQKTEKIQVLPVTNVNLNIGDITCTPIYFIDNNLPNASYHLFEISVDSLFEQGSTNRKLFIEEAYEPYIINKTNDMFVVDKILILCNFDSEQTTCILDLNLHISYKKNRIGRFKSYAYGYKYFNIILKFRYLSNVLIPTEKFQLAYHKSNYKKIGIEDKIKKYSLGTMKEKKEEVNKIIASATINIYCYNDYHELNLNEEVDDSRKILLHDHLFGNGKTTYDIMSVIDQNRIPVVISPWEANYDHDILYLIFDTLRRDTETKKFNIEQNTSLFFYATMAIVLPFVLDYFSDIFQFLTKCILAIGEPLLSTNATILKVFSWLQITLGSDNHTISTKIIIYIVLFIIFIKLYKRILPNLIIFKKDYTQIYKNFFIKEIVQMLKKHPNYILLIEDVDRLSSKSQEETFRILSSINSEMPKCANVFCIISYANLIKKETQEHEAQIDPIVDYKAIENKLIYGYWGKEYKVNLSMYKYLDLNLSVFAFLMEHSVPYDDTNNYISSLIETEKINFRSLRADLRNIKDLIFINSKFNMSSRKIDEISLRYLQEKYK